MNLKISLMYCCASIYPNGLSQGLSHVKQRLTIPYAVIQSLVKALFDQLAALYQACLTLKAKIWTNKTATQQPDEVAKYFSIPASKANHCYVLPLKVDLSQLNANELLAFENVFWEHTQQALAKHHLFTEHPILEVEIRLAMGETGEYKALLISRPILDRILKQKENYSLVDLFRNYSLTFEDGQMREVNGFLYAILRQDSDYFKTLLPDITRQYPNSNGMTQHISMSFRKFNSNQDKLNCSSILWDKILNILYFIENKELFKVYQTKLKSRFSFAGQENMLALKPKEFEEHFSLLCKAYVGGSLMILPWEDLLECASVFSQFNFNNVWKEEFFDTCSDIIWNKFQMESGKIDLKWGSFACLVQLMTQKDEEIYSNSNSTDDKETKLRKKYVESREVSNSIALYAFSQQYGFEKLQEKLSEQISVFLKKFFRVPNLFIPTIQMLRNQEIEYLNQLVLPLDSEISIEDYERNFECLKQMAIKAVSLEFDYEDEIQDADMNYSYSDSDLEEDESSKMLSLHKQAVTEKGLAVLREISCLEELHITSLMIQNEHISHLEDLKIKRIFFNECKCSPDVIDLSYLTRLPLEMLATNKPHEIIPYIQLMPHLRHLDLTYLQRSDFNNLVSPSLKVLTLNSSGNSSYEDESSAHPFANIYKHLPILEELELNEVGLEDHYFKDILKLPLKKLKIHNPKTKLAGEFFKHLKEISVLEELELSWIFDVKMEKFLTLTSQSLKKLSLYTAPFVRKEALKDLHKRLPCLEELKLSTSEIDITDEWIKELASMSKLKKLYVNQIGSKITQAAVNSAAERGLSIIITDV